MRRSTVAWTAAGGAFIAVLLGQLHYSLRPEDVPNPYASTHLTIAITSGGIGAWAAATRPRHPVGWALLSAGLLCSWMFAAQPLIVESYLLGAPSWLLRTMGVNISWPWVAARSLLVIVAVSLVPHGWPRGVRRWVLVAGIGVTVVLCVAQAVMQWRAPFDDAPWPEDRLQDVLVDVADTATKLQWALGAAAAIGLVVTITRDRALLRQTRWFAVGAVLLAVPALSVLGSAAWPDVSWPGDQWERAASGLLPLALAASVVLDHFLEVHVVVRRTVLFGGLMVFGAMAFASLSAVLAAGSDVDAPVRRAVAAGATALLFVPLVGS